MHGKGVQDEPAIPVDVTWVVPCFNERNRLDLGPFRSFLQKHNSTRLLFVDDGSSDGTADLILDGMAGVSNGRSAVLQLPENRGKAGAIHAGFNACLDQSQGWRNQQLIGFVDADLATPLDELPNLVSVLQRRVDIHCVFGSRRQLAGRKIRRHPIRRLLGATFSRVASRTFGFSIGDTQCGAKLFRAGTVLRNIFATPFSDRWLFDVEILARYRRELGATAVNSIYEYPLDDWHEIAGSRLKWSDFAKAPWTLLKLIANYAFYSNRAPSAAMSSAADRIRLDAGRILVPPQNQLPQLWDYQADNPNRSTQMEPGLPDWTKSHPDRRAA